MGACSSNSSSSSPTSSAASPLSPAATSSTSSSAAAEQRTLLACQSSLPTLFLGGAPFLTPACCEMISAALLQHPIITALHLRGATMGKAGSRALGQALAMRTHGIRELKLLDMQGRERDKALWVELNNVLFWGSQDTKESSSRSSKDRKGGSSGNTSDTSDNNNSTNSVESGSDNSNSNSGDGSESKGLISHLEVLDLSYHQNSRVASVAVRLLRSPLCVLREVVLNQCLIEDSDYLQLLKLGSKLERLEIGGSTRLLDSDLMCGFDVLLKSHTLNTLNIRGLVPLIGHRGELIVRPIVKRFKEVFQQNISLHCVYMVSTAVPSPEYQTMVDHVRQYVSRNIVVTFVFPAAAEHLLPDLVSLIVSYL